MKAWIVTKNGAPRQALTLKTDYPVPSSVKSGNLLVKVDYAALNPADLNFMSTLPNWLPFRRNPTVGLDFVGKVVRVGSAVSTAKLGISVGSEVGGALNVVSVAIGRGSLAEYIEVPAAKVVLKPTKIQLRDAAGALGVAGQTAQVVLKSGNVKPGDRVLVNGASGGVGSVLVQVAKARGATVYGVCSGANADMVRGLGADEVIDYKAHDSLSSYLAQQFKPDSKPLHLILDTVGSDELFRKCSSYLDRKGAFITIVGGIGHGTILRSKLLPTILGGTPRRFEMLSLFPDGAIAKEVAKWIEDGDFHDFPVDSEYPMEQAVEAYERVASKRSKGKVIVKVSE
ncbi:NAD(P)-binding protein [Cryphonectria parasitica EP155]|uniref:NAD(P)-binding protein n=1 Tax=Cryphonectria parasitica (strain ATCC 38755 / EP155) TaxID=660469 RepID=A0A9P4XZF1_CRYP1|nr:NAD(P)-binding protein [Cryphonectria parasitica EP155]KAF3764154.1 NAD(P)-binding protein [Cryphonectria parasitica EP155]